MDTTAEGSDDEEETGFDEEQEPMDDETAEDEFTFSHGPQTSSGENEAVEMDPPQGEGQGGRSGNSGGKGGGKKGQKKNAGLARKWVAALRICLHLLLSCN